VIPVHPKLICLLQNWFQNRRAKAKQQKKQEEFEAQNGGSVPSEPDGQSKSKAASSTPSSPTKSMTSPIRRSAPLPVSHDSPSPTKHADASKEASWASLQRALNQAKAAQSQQAAKVTMAPPELPPQPAAIKLPVRPNQGLPDSRLSAMDPLSRQRANIEPYPSPITLQDNTFDFGFDQDTFDTGQMVDPIDPNSNYASQSFVVTPEDWDEPLATPKHIVHQHDPLTALPSPGLTMPSYPGSRRQSTTEELSNNFGNFALVNSSPNIIAARRNSEVIRAPENGNLDIAARRKRPRPAALTSSSLRSRSYGAMTSVSPTFRQGMITPSAPHTVRHVKSANHMNARYSGVRKASSAQRSPMCVASFAEAEAFRQLMGQQATVAQSLSELPQPLLSPDAVSGGQLHEPEKNPLFAQNIHVSHQFQGPIHIATASPPITPMAADFMTRGLSQQSLIPPASAPPQYASFPDYTPPYSAGPLTGGSWSDAPLTSPEVPSFPPVTYIPSLGYPQQCDVLSNNFQQFVLPSDPNTDLSLDAQLDQKRTEFFIQEFPNQKREHAHVAQQLAQQKPKSYVFNNSAPHDYDQE